MKISLLTDSPKHNLALMKISTYHKNKGDEVKLNMPLWKADYIYGSWLFDDGCREKTDSEGGIGIDPAIELPDNIKKLKPDYSLFNLNHSLGYTFRDCYRKCSFCKVPFLPRDRTHHSIWEFHNPKFDSIELLDNNLFFDPLCIATFEEIKKANLKLNENGMDLRLLDDQKAWWIKQLRWKTQPKFAWDEMKDEKKIIEGMKLLKKHKVRVMVYILMGYNTCLKEDLYRCEIIINSFDFIPFPMLYKPNKILKKFKRFLYLRYYKQHKTVGEAWKAYGRRNLT